MQPLTLKQLFMDKFDIQPTIAQTRSLIRYVQMYELRDQNPAAFNTPMLAVSRAYFLPKDAAFMFDNFNIYRPDFNRAIHDCVSVNKSFHVTGNDFNILCIWLVYCYLKSNLNPQMQHDGAFWILALLNYKFFTGKVQTFFPKGVNHDVMQATIDRLSAKNDIKRPETPTWRAIIYDHCETILAENSVHNHTLHTFSPDSNVLYVISDLHTRLASKISNVSHDYYENVAKGVIIKSSDATQLNAEGERELKALRATLDNTIINVCGVVTNTSSFLSYLDIKSVCALTKTITPPMLEEALIAFSDMATLQYRHHEEDKVVTIKGQKYFVGFRILVTEIIQKCYRYCVLKKVDMRSNMQILEMIRNAFKSSRVDDPDIITIKYSMDKFVHEHTKYKRDATKVSIRTAVILYFILLTFKRA